MSAIWQTTAKGLMALTLLCVLNCCTYQKTHSRPKLQELPVPVAVKPEKVAVAPKTPSEVETSPKLQELPVPVAVKPEKVAVAPKTPSEVETLATISEQRFYIHRVRWKGETLFIIAKWYTGSGKNWKALSNANPKLNPNRFLINDNIFIPEELMKSRKPMPLSFLSSSVRKKFVQSFPSNKPSIENDVAELFEPIEADQPSIESGRVELFGPIENDRDFFDSDIIELFKPIE